LVAGQRGFDRVRTGRYVERTTKGAPPHPLAVNRNLGPVREHDDREAADECALLLELRFYLDTSFWRNRGSAAREVRTERANRFYMPTERDVDLPDVVQNLKSGRQSVRKVELLRGIRESFLLEGGNTVVEMCACLGSGV